MVNSNHHVHKFIHKHIIMFEVNLFTKQTNINKFFSQDVHKHFDLFTALQNSNARNTKKKFTTEIVFFFFRSTTEIVKLTNFY